MIARLRAVLWIGIVLLFVPFLGVPDWLRTIVIITIGVVLIYIFYTLRRSYKKLKFELRQGVSAPVENSSIIHG